MFIGREKELKALEEEYQESKFRMSIIYGRRRIGKSTLIAEFIKNKKAIYYTATKVGKQRNLELFAKQIIATVDPNLNNASFPTLEDLFDFFTSKLTREQLVLVIDELPFWAEKDEGLLSVLQKYIDNKWLNKNLFIILCGSSLSFMESQILSEKSPLFGRRTSQIKLDAFDYLESSKFVPDYSNEEKAICYGITGGVAKYLSLINTNLSLDENIKKLFFKTSGYLYDETRNLLAQEFSETTLVNNVIEQIASGQNTVNTIANKIHEKEQTILYSLDKLINVGLVEKKHCIFEEKNKKKTQYVLKDYMFKFWYEFVSKACSVIEMGAGESYYEKAVKNQLHSYMGKIFEDMCRYYVFKHGIAGDYNSFITQTGIWWGTETITDETGKKVNQSADIDIVAVSTIDKTFVIGECKFRKEKLDKSTYEALVRREKALPTKYKLEKYLLFSLSGFTDWFKKSSNPQITLLTLDDLYKSFGSFKRGPCRAI